MEFTTADLCDRFPDEVTILQPVLRDYGGLSCFAGPIETLDVYEDRLSVRQVLESPGEGRILVVDGGASLDAALLDSELAELARANGWVGLVINGCIRNVAQLAKTPLGVRALAPCPNAGRSSGRGSSGNPVHFGGVTFRQGHFLYADQDGLVVARQDLLGASGEENDEEE